MATSTAAAAASDAACAAPPTTAGPCATCTCERSALAQNFVGSVADYDKHVFLTVGTPASEWPSDLLAVNSFVNAFQKASKRLKKGGHLDVRLRVTITDAPAEADGHDVWVFPDGVAYKGMRPWDVPALLSQIAGANPIERLGLRSSTADAIGDLSGAQPLAPPSPLPGSVVFVCSHAAVDERCGTLGPLVRRALERELKAQALDENVKVFACSHVGGHKYAGNVLLFGGGLHGDWYGLIDEHNVPALVKTAIIRGEIFRERWRGRLGLSAVAMQKALDSTASAAALANAAAVAVRESRAELAAARTAAAPVADGASSAAANAESGPVVSSSSSSVNSAADATVSMPPTSAAAAAALPESSSSHRARAAAVTSSAPPAPPAASNPTIPSSGEPAAAADEPVSWGTVTRGGVSETAAPKESQASLLSAVIPMLVVSVAFYLSSAS